MPPGTCTNLGAGMTHGGGGMRLKVTNSRNHQRLRSDGKPGNQSERDPRLEPGSGRWHRVTHPSNHTTQQLVSAVQRNPRKAHVGGKFSGSGQINHKKSGSPLRTVCFCSRGGKATPLCAHRALEKAPVPQDSFQLFSSVFGKLPTAFQVPGEESLKKKKKPLQIQQCFCRNDYRALYFAGSAISRTAGAVQEVTLL